MTQFFAEELFATGYTDLVSVIPPDAQLSPNSKIPQTALGKVPGRRLPNGLWAGYNWRKSDASADDVRSWCLMGANVGLRADRFPGVDIDCHDAQLVRIITQTALATLGPAPIRVGRAPKQLLMYRTEEPFGRMRVWIDDKHLVEILGQGQQYLMSGIHPGTKQPYEWTSPPGAAGDLTLISRAQADAFVVELMAMLGTFAKVEREGDGRPVTRTAALDQDALHAPSVELVRDAVACIPNTNDLFPDRTDYIRMGYAIRAAVGEEHLDEGLGIFEEWALKWEGNARSEKNNAEKIYEDWSRMRGQKAVGWPWLAETARRFGFNDASLEFGVLRQRPEDAPAEPKPELSDRGLADAVIERLRDDVRVCNQTDKFLVWTQGKWSPDDERLAEWLIHDELAKMGTALLTHGANEKEKKANYGHAMALCSAAKATTVTSIVKMHRDIAVSLAALDSDSWLLNTPGGIVDLHTGKLEPARREAMCTKATSFTPLMDAECPQWLRFLAEATAGNDEVIGYLRRLCGYCLTGSTEEHQLTFIWGPGGNGKSVFLTTLASVLGDYARTAPMDTFTASSSDRHSTELAMLHGARLVTASETEAGKRWAEARLKSLTGGEPVTARYMRQDFFTYLPQFKLVFTGNHKPEIRDVDDGMRRRIQLLPFDVKPKVIDPKLTEKLRAEGPAILGWMIKGCLEWQEKRLAPPAAVQSATEEYFDNEDEYGRWMRDYCTAGEALTSTTQDLFTSWSQWCGANGVKYVGSVKRLSSSLISKRFKRWEEPGTRRQGFAGLAPKNRQEFEIA